VGDIGPKIGFLTKDNGYMLLNHVRIPRTNMLSRYVGINKEGQLEVSGNPKIVYATMMIVRKLISTVWPKVYGQGIAIACRYSLFRRQFKNEQREEITIMEYQTQQAKLLPLIAEFYGISLAGNRIAKLTE
jgi:acyl-CoA oxidase